MVAVNPKNLIRVMLAEGRKTFDLTCSDFLLLEN